MEVVETRAHGWSCSFQLPMPWYPWYPRGIMALCSRRSHVMTSTDMRRRRLKVFFGCFCTCAPLSVLDLTWSLSSDFFLLKLHHEGERDISNGLCGLEPLRLLPGVHRRRFCSKSTECQFWVGFLFSWLSRQSGEKNIYTMRSCFIFWPGSSSDSSLELLDLSLGDGNCDMRTAGKSIIKERLVLINRYDLSILFCSSANLLPWPTRICQAWKAQSYAFPGGTYSLLAGDLIGSSFTSLGQEHNV